VVTKVTVLSDVPMATDCSRSELLRGECAKPPGSLMPPGEAVLAPAVPWLLLWRHLPRMGEAARAALGAELPHRPWALVGSADPEGPGLGRPRAVPAWVSMPSREGPVACRDRLGAGSAWRWGSRDTLPARAAVTTSLEPCISGASSSELPSQHTEPMGLSCFNGPASFKAFSHLCLSSGPIPPSGWVHPEVGSQEDRLGCCTARGAGSEHVLHSKA